MRPTYFQAERHFQVPAITAPFQRADQAEAAARALREAGFKASQVDRLEPVPAGRENITAQPWPQSLTDQGTDLQRFIASADESISGLSADELLGEAPYLLTVVLDDPAPEARERALAILRQHGALIGVDRALPRRDRWDAQTPES